MGIVRPGGAVGRVGVPHYEAIPGAQPVFYSNVIVGGGPAPVRAYIDELCPTSWRAASSPAASSTAPSISTACPTAIAR